MTPFPAPSSSPLTLWPHVGCLSPQTSRPVRPELVVPSSLLLGACLPGVLSWLPLPASAPGPCLSWPFLGLCFPLCPLSLPLASSSRSGGTASSSLVSALSLVLLFPSCSLPPSRLPLPPTYPDCTPGPALFLLATPPSHSQLCHFFPHGMSCWGAGHLSPSPLVRRSPLPCVAATCSPPQPHQPWSATRRRNQPIPNFPLQDPKDHNLSLLCF